MEDAVCLVCQCTEEVGGCLQGWIGILSNTDIAHPVPLFLMFLGTPVPAEKALCGLLALKESAEGLGIEVTVIWMDIGQTLLIAHTFLWQEISMHVMGIALLNREFQHVVVAGIKGVLHDGREFLHLLRVLTDTENGDAVDGPTDEKGNNN